jgi:hypothetical protein
MAAYLEKLPLTLTVDAIISFLRYVFSNENLAPANYRFVEDIERTEGTRKTEIKISAQMPINDEKNISTPNVVVVRGAYQKNTSINENLANGSENTFSTMKQLLVYDGIITIMVNSNHASEATNLATFITLMIEANKRSIIEATKFIRFLDGRSISEEMPSEPAPNVTRWTVVINFFTSIYLAVWYREIEGENLFEKVSVRSISERRSASGTAGSITATKNTMTDLTKSFGFTDDSDPKFNKKEFDKKWYYLKFEKDVYYYIITKIADDDKHTLELSMVGENGQLVDFEASESLKNLNYEILWNSNHIYVNVPKLV